MEKPNQAITNKSDIEKNRLDLSPHSSEAAGICPKCGLPLEWRRAGKTGELYRRCSNYRRGCKYNDRKF